MKRMVTDGIIYLYYYGIYYNITIKYIKEVC